MYQIEDPVMAWSVAKAISADAIHLEQIVFAIRKSFGLKRILNSTGVFSGFQNGL